MKLTKEIRDEVLALKQKDNRLSSRSIAKIVGVHHKTVNRILRGASIHAGPQFRKPEPPSPESFEVKGNDATVFIKKTRICTLEELVEHCKIDLNIWHVDRFICNKWEVGSNVDGEIVVEPLFQIKAFLKRKNDAVAIRKELDEIKSIYFDLMPTPKFVKRPSGASGLMLEINLPDVHFGKLAWGVETGHANYDVKIAEIVYWQALQILLSRVAHYNFDKVVFVVGNDILNSDDIEGRTTGETYVSSDARYHKTFAAVRNIMIRSIELLREIAPVKVIIVGGNHDQLSCWHLGDSLEMYFHKHEDVEFDNLPRQRKYHQHGKVMLMFTHGHKGKKDEYPLIMATEQPVMFGTTLYRECHTGHTHTTKLDEKHGVRVRVLPALCAPDDWHAENGYVGNLRNAEAYVWSSDEGLITQAFYTVPEE